MVLLVALPTDRELSRRLALDGSLLIGAALVVWSLPWADEVNCGALVCAVGTGSGAAWVLVAPRPASRLRSIVPRLRAADALVVASGLAAWLMVHRWALVSSPSAALKLFLPGYDNALHFLMFDTLRQHSGPLYADGSSYPQGFHALVASYAQLGLPADRGGVDGLVAFAHGTAVVVVLGTVTAHRRRLLARRRASPASGGSSSRGAGDHRFIWEPGPKLIEQGFGNFGPRGSRPRAPSSWPSRHHRLHAPEMS